VGHPLRREVDVVRRQHDPDPFGSPDPHLLAVSHDRLPDAHAPPIGTWTSWAVAMPDADWEEHDEQSVWEEIDD
jgi:hypothetical protein